MLFPEFSAILAGLCVLRFIFMLVILLVILLVD